MQFCHGENTGIHEALQESVGLVLRNFAEIIKDKRGMKRNGSAR